VLVPGCAADRRVRLARGRTLAGYAQTESGAGTHFNAVAAQAVALPDGRWRVSGEKVWIGNAQWSNVLTVVAHEVDTNGRRRGLMAFAVRTDQSGVVLGRELSSMRMRGVVQGEVSFRDVLVDRDHVEGEHRARRGSRRSTSCASSRACSA
jgi:alkylation response protein AidB-like acyl-CoA dehydrogenase